MSLSGRRKRGEGSAAEMIGVSTPDDLQTGPRMCPATGFHGSHNGRLVHDPYRDTPAFLVENGKAPDTDHPTGNTGHDHPPGELAESFGAGRASKSPKPSAGGHLAQGEVLEDFAPAVENLDPSPTLVIRATAPS